VTFALTVLGSGTVAPSASRTAPGHWVEAGAQRLLLDCGAGVLHRAAEHGIPWHTVTHLAITHFHADHWGELPHVLFALRWGIEPPRATPLVLLGPAGLGERLEHLKTSVAFIRWQEEHYTQGLVPGTDEYAMNQAAVNRRMFTATAYPGTDLFEHPRVKQLLGESFGITFDAAGHPVCDEALHYYVLELDDATKVLKNPRGEPLYYGDMDLDVFLEAREHVNRGETFKILDL